MSANPFLAKQPPSVDPIQKLQDHVNKLNNYRWVVASGKLYYIASRELADGSIERFIDRYI